MGHDIYGINKNGEEVAYARFSMGNPNAIFLYTIMDADNYNAGVSGTGEVTTFSLQQMEKSWNAFKKYYSNTPLESDQEFEHWDEKQIFNFIRNCLTTAQKEGSVKVFFG